jgi:SAM-dependent methyltransferase
VGTEVWASGAAYEPYVGRWSRLVASEFLRWLAIRDGARWVDVGCGTGAVVEAILRQADPSEVVGIDSSPAYVAYAQADIIDPRARFEVGSASALRGTSAPGTGRSDRPSRATCPARRLASRQGAAQSRFRRASVVRRGLARARSAAWSGNAASQRGGSSLQSEL